MQIGKKEFDFDKKVYVMGILNVTPDSFSDGGSYTDMDAAKERVAQMIAEGAHIIDVGGESTRPGHQKISDEEEMQRVIPVIRMIKENFDVPVSVDTYKSSVAEFALKEHVDMINDIWGFQWDKKMAELTAKYDVPVCLMHNRKDMSYKNLMEDMMADLEKSVDIATQYGVSKDKIILDPGIGFAKTYEQNLCVMNHLDQICNMGYPVLLGTSRKSMIGQALELPVEERLEGTIATTVYGVMKGCGMVRVHDVKENARAIKMMEAMCQESR